MEMINSTSTNYQPILNHLGYKTCEIIIIVLLVLLGMSTITIVYLLIERFHYSEASKKISTQSISPVKSEEMKGVLLEAQNYRSIGKSLKSIDILHNRLQEKSDSKKIIKDPTDVTKERVVTANEEKMSLSKSQNSFNSGKSNLTLGQHLLDISPNEEIRDAQTVPNIIFNNIDRVMSTIKSKSKKKICQ